MDSYYYPLITERRIQDCRTIPPLPPVHPPRPPPGSSDELPLGLVACPFITQHPLSRSSYVSLPLLPPASNLLSLFQTSTSKHTQTHTHKHTHRQTPHTHKHAQTHT